MADAAFAVAEQMRDELQARILDLQAQLAAANAQRDRCHNELVLLRNTAVQEIGTGTAPEDKDTLLKWRGCSQ